MFGHDDITLQLHIILSATLVQDLQQSSTSNFVRKNWSEANHCGGAKVAAAIEIDASVSLVRHSNNREVEALLRELALWKLGK
jgi:hypothetical protein